MERCRPIAFRISSQIAQILLDLEAKFINSFTTDTSPESKELKLLLKMEINKKVTQITPACDQMQRIAQEIVMCIRDRCKSEASIAFALLTFAKKLIEHGESMVATHPPSAFTLAAVAVAIGGVIPEFMDVLFACFYRCSIYTVPKYLDTKALSEDDRRKALGYRSADESEEAFTERQSGIVSLFAAVLVTPFSDSRLVEYAWVWLASLLNEQPHQQSSAILGSFLEISAVALQQRYGRQFRKILLLLRDDYFKLLPPSSISSNTRLQLLVDMLLRRQ